MSLIAFEGPAGSGKTFQLLEYLRLALKSQPLQAGQRVLAITFMHGSRRKLEASLRVIPGLRGRYECATVDSVAFRWAQRWQDLAKHRGLQLPEDGAFDKVCAITAQLVSDPMVRDWITASFPLVLVDEVQDLTATRLSIVRALGERATCFIAGDEFQCLQEGMSVNPFADWRKTGLTVTRLEQIMRTDVAALLAAAAALRAGGAPRAAGVFKIQATPSPALAGSYLANAIAWYGRGGTVAVLTPSVTPFVTKAVEWAQSNKTKQGNGPIRIVWERAEKEELAEVLARLKCPRSLPLDAARQAVERLAEPTIAPYVLAWLERQGNALGRTEVSRAELEQAIGRAVANRRRFGATPTSRTSAMTVHTAKNREFDGVVVLWPYQVGGSEEQKRRLLYNAITRARNWACILVQGERIPPSGPFG